MKWKKKRWGGVRLRLYDGEVSFGDGLFAFEIPVETEAGRVG